MFDSIGQEDPANPPRREPLTAVLRALSGVSVGGFIILSGVLIGAQYTANRAGYPGPGTWTVGIHLLMALLGVLAQVWTDRQRPPRVYLGSLGILVTLGLTLWFYWFA
ncbi:hypothetical protein D5S17_25695 [Pseudonocardiaceae bacterium YIM PH 21723]|nr:hypothetical protein D5S17_25695 [Pseudonocardiaceae bacterium YIM PH 21723]